MPLFLLPLINFLRPYLAKIMLGLAVLLFVLGAAVYIHHHIVATERQRAADQLAVQRANAVNAAVDKLKADNAEAQKENADLQQKLDAAQTQARQFKVRLSHEIANHPEYHTCRVPVDGLRILADAVSGTAPRRAAR